MTDKVTTEDRGAVRILRIDRPDQRNCVDGETAVGLARAIEAFAADDGARVLVVTGAGELAVCAGADLKNAATLFEHEYLDPAGPMGFARLDPGKPTIAAANAEFGCLSRRWGVPYTDGGTQRFPRIMGTGNALYMLMTGARFDAWRAYEMGFVQEVVPAGQALARALELAETIAGYPNVAGICADRRAVLHGLSRELDDGLRLEAEVVRPACFSEELVAGLARFAGGARDASPRPPAARSEHGSR